MKIAVIGAGNGGHAIAGFLAAQDHHVALYDRDSTVVNSLEHKGGIVLEGRISGYGKLGLVTTNLEDVVRGVEIIMIATIANAHGVIAQQISQYLTEGQIIILNPGRTGGALEFAETLKKTGCKTRIYLAEAQTLIYACRLKEIGLVNIIGIKDKVLLSAFPSSDLNYVMNKIASLYSCFQPVKNVLHTSFENIGAIFHPCIILFNAAAIERGNKFYFYREMTDTIADFIEKFDTERLLVGKAYNVPLVSVKEWVSYAYKGIQGNTYSRKHIM